MFSGCTSLKYLIISNFIFNITMAYNVDQIFKDLQSLEYIDIYNIKDINNYFKNEVNGENGLINQTNITVCKKHKT